MAGPFYQFEVEHVYAQTIFNSNTRRADLLRQYGYVREMASNKIALFKSAEVVEQIANAPDDHPFIQWLIDSGWGPVRHDGSDNGGGEAAREKQVPDRYNRSLDCAA